jgi:hypothetical protein
MAHSLAHALMTEVAIDCGYPASALKERVYLLRKRPGSRFAVRNLADGATDSGHPT